MDAALRRVTQRAVLDGMFDLAGSSAATAEVQAIAGGQIERLRQRVTSAVDAADHGHRAAALRDIARYADGRDDRATRPRPAAIALPWP